MVKFGTKISLKQWTLKDREKGLNGQQNKVLIVFKCGASGLYGLNYWTISSKPLQRPKQSFLEKYYLNHTVIERA